MRDAITGEIIGQESGSYTSPSVALADAVALLIEMEEREALQQVRGSTRTLTENPRGRVTDWAA